MREGVRMMGWSIELEKMVEGPETTEGDEVFAPPGLPWWWSFMWNDPGGGGFEMGAGYEADALTAMRKLARVVVESREDIACFALARVLEPVPPLLYSMAGRLDRRLRWLQGFGRN